ncbi:YifB family Mg chelatase-like AAA ATPase [Nocardioidaceae bacterium SCSIO 66511]|nr:YifB family Mg chelatase-like AAA ATPase [Nocardioidaceae bacterium SCSIO 66511]
MARTRSVALEGTRGHLVEVEADISPGLPTVTVVGLPDASLGEARARCRAAVTNSKRAWPDRKVTIGLSPASLPKFGSHYDLSIAIAVLAAAGEVPRAALADTIFLGELALDGMLRGVPGVLPSTLAAVDAGCARIIVPEVNAPEAELVGQVEVHAVRSLRHVVAILRAEPIPDDPPVLPMVDSASSSWCEQDRLALLDMRDVVGQDAGRISVTVAAAGGHHLFLHGPPGVGKTMLSERLPGLLPDLGHREAMEVMAVHSVAGILAADAPLIRRPPFLDPHHSASKPAVIGGGGRVVRPGAMSLAHRGVLFLDEAPEFNRDIMEALRQPLESGRVTIARAARTAEYPARFQLVLAANPCPCGRDGTSTSDLCTCTTTSKRKYHDKLSGPVLDRIDVHRTVESISVRQLHEAVDDKVDTASIAALVEKARHRQRDRYAGTPWRINAEAPGAELRRHWPMSSDADALIDKALARSRVSPRAADRIVRLAWTVADLTGVERPGVAEARAAMQLRMDEPIDGPLLGVLE